MPRAAKKDLSVYQGDDHSWPMTIQRRIDATTVVPFDLAGHTLSAQIRADVADLDATIDASFTFQITDEAGGKFVMILPSESTEAMDLPRYKWDLQITRDADDYIVTLAYGSIVMTKEVTRV
jgi:hypothetical protein